MQHFFENWCQNISWLTLLLIIKCHQDALQWLFRWSVCSTNSLALQPGEIDPSCNIVELSFNSEISRDDINSISPALPARALVSAPLWLAGLLSPERLWNSRCGRYWWQGSYRRSSWKWRSGVRSGDRGRWVGLWYCDLLRPAGILSTVGAKPAILQDGGTISVKAVGDAAVWPALHERALKDRPEKHWIRDKCLNILSIQM